MHKYIYAALPLVIALAIISLLVGNHSLQFNAESWDILMISRIPRTLALILAGVSLSVAGVIMQQLARNKFVEPSTTGTVESATFGMLMMLIFFPEASVFYKLLVACISSVIGTALFLLILRKVPLRSGYVVPLIGIMYAGVIGAIITFVAYRAELLQSIWVWVQGDFSMILRGRYELLWLAGGLSLIAYFTADKLTLAGLGKQVSINLGLNYTLVFVWGLVVVSLITGVTVVNSGVIPFLGLVVPNIISLLVGDNLRRSLPLIAISGAGLVLLCDILARVINYPYEIPIATVMGIIGSVIFLYLLLREDSHAN
ncbi:MAG: iron chelate uptake ABC transporter family permease subunit [Oceanospirillaceae bacterium]|nr:iron chelate uptake ABC transporter family permease subunit [Oceanospirillaceae bacterium]